ncbi:MAG: hypothetical protein ACJ72J_06715 [Nitrososphaeraceae archaeon]
MVRRGVSETQANDLEFIQVISQFPNRNAKIGSSKLRILRFFITKPYLSTYQIQKDLKEKGENIKDEKIRQRVISLHSLNLIEEIKNKKELKFEERRRQLNLGTVYYKLTTGGLFYLIYNDNYFLRTLSPVLMSHFIRHHGDNIIFKTFLYSCLGKQTLLELKGKHIFEQIFKHLYDSCDFTEKVIDSLERCNDTSEMTVPLFNWADTTGRYHIDNLRFLENVFDLHLGQNIKLEKIDKGKTLRISNQKGYITLIKLSENKDRVFLNAMDGRQYELSMDSLDNKLIIGIQTEAAKKYLLETFGNYIKNIPYSLVFSLSIILNLAHIEMREHNWNVLMNDAKFKHWHDEINKSSSQNTRIF